MVNSFCVSNGARSYIYDMRFDYRCSQRVHFEGDRPFIVTGFFTSTDTLAGAAAAFENGE